MKSAYHEEKLISELSRVVSDVAQHSLLVSTQPYAMSALASLLHSLSLQATVSAAQRYSLRAFNVHQHCQLDHSAFTALNLFPPSSSTPALSLSSTASPSSASPSAADELSIFSLLNKTRTAMGSRLLSRFIRQPLLELSAISARHDVVAYFVSHTQVRSHLRESSACLRRFPDVDAILRKLQRDRAKLIDVVRLYQVVVKVGVMCEALQTEAAGSEGGDVLQQRYVTPLRECEREMEQFVAMCDAAVDMEQSERSWYTECCLRGDFSPEMKQVERRKAQLRRQMEELQQQAADELGLEGKVSLDFQSCHLRITNREEQRTRLSHPYVIIDSKKDGTRFTTAELQLLASEYKAVVKQYSEMQQLYLSQLLETTLTYSAVVDRMSGLIAELDVLLAFAHVATAMDGYVRPVMREMGSGVLRMKDSRHPLLEDSAAVGRASAAAGDAGSAEEPLSSAALRSFIPNDVELVSGRSHCVIITGPNMGGKSTYIRQIGVCCLLAQIGSFVPARAAELSVVDAILCRIGAADQQAKGVSTYDSERSLRLARCSTRPTV